MANQIDGIDLSGYGLVLRQYKNLLNMPDRIGSVFIDWGNEYEPIVQEEDIYWNANVIILKCIYDPRLGSSINETLNTLSEKKDCTLTTDYGTWEVVLKSVTETEEQSGFYYITIEFEQYVSSFDPPGTPSGSGIFTIDGYDLKTDFGIIINEIKNLDNIPEYILSENTVYKVPKERSDLRKWNEVTIGCTLTRSIANVQNLENFKNLLASPGLKELNYLASRYDCFMNRGFEVVFDRSKIQFKVQLNVGKRKPYLRVTGNGLEIPPGTESTSVANGTFFPNFDVRAGVDTQNFLIHNDSDSSISITSVQAVGEGFNISTQPSGSIPAGSNTQFTVTYDPTEHPKTYSARIEIWNGDSLYNPYTFRVAGSTSDSALLGIMSVTGINDLVISNGDNTPSLTDGTDFGDVAILKSKTYGFKVKNTGAGALNIISVEVGGTFWSIASEPGAQILAGNYGILGIKAAPTLQISTTNTVTIQWTDGFNSTIREYTFSVGVTGIPYVAPVGIEVWYIPTNTQIPNDVGPSSTYGTIFDPIETDSGDKDVRPFLIKCTGETPITSVVLENPGVNFSFEYPLYVPLYPGKQQNVSLRFMPVTEGVYPQTIQFKTSESTYFLNVTGTGTPSYSNTQIQLRGKDNKEIALFNNVWNIWDGTEFPPIPNYTTWEQTFRIYNIGNTILNYDTYTLGFSDQRFSELYGPGSGTCYPDDYREFTVRYTADLVCQSENGCITVMGFGINSTELGSERIYFQVYLKATTS